MIFRILKQKYYVLLIYCKFICDKFSIA